MTDAERSWWQKRRWRAVIAFWLALPLAYVLGTGPVLYGVLQGWLPPAVYLEAYAPLWRVIDQTSFDDPIIAYQSWWRGLAEQQDLDR